MLENAIYSVISPEGCASILWRDAGFAEQAAQSLRLTAPDLLAFGLIDRIVPEPREGAQSDHRQAAELLDKYLGEALAAVSRLSDSERVARRYQKFRVMGEIEKLGSQPPDASNARRASE
jgi:acetyl-CoA carboxylase carboxyl transferase subunit alpha